MAKMELFRNPLLRRLFLALGALPVDRGGNDVNAMKTAIKCLQGGERLVLFPEGTGWKTPATPAPRAAR